MLGIANCQLAHEEDAAPGIDVVQPEESVAKMCDDLKLVLVEAGEDCTVVFLLFDANYYLAKSDEGGLLPIRKLVTGDYHVEGELAFAPKELQYSIFALPNLF